MSRVNDQDLIAQLREGSLEALGQLYDQHRQMVYRTALAITGDPEAASDLLQDVFLRLHRFADRLDPLRPLEPWLYRMTTNLAYTWVKRSHRWRWPLEELADWLAGGDNNPSYSHVELQDDWHQVQLAVSALPLQQRIVVVLYYLNDLSLQEIAEILEIPVGTVKSRLHYGRSALKKSLGLNDKRLPDFYYKRP
jgi:RNA polymerase sigma-70 factor (ECF subfamily)